MINDNESIKVLFLDIDGVLNHDDFYNRQRSNPKEWENIPHPLTEFDPECIKRLNRIVEETGVKIVISSEWRFTKGLDNILASVGLRYPIFDTTPYYYSKRSEEINRWLRDYNVEQYIIVDDIDFFTEEQHKHFIQTSFSDGLTEEKTQKIINYFK